MLSLRIQQPDSLKLYLKDNTEKLNLTLNTILTANDFKHYKGEYTVNPDYVNQTLETKNLVMDKNVNVTPIMVRKTENKQGGFTVNIGG